MKKSLNIIFSLALIFTFVFSLSACSMDSSAPTVEISEDGYWIINGEKTDVKAEGEKGDTGAQGEKGDKGDTGAQGEKGDKGDTGAQGEKGDKGDTGAQGEKGDKGDTGAEGEKGEPGVPGEAPTFEVSDDGYWIINGILTEYKATGEVGESGASIETVEFDELGRLVITLDNGLILEPVELPSYESHVHVLGEYFMYGDGMASCEDALFYAICDECGDIKWRKGTSDDHSLEYEYTFDEESHWIKCGRCDFVDYEGAHRFKNSCDTDCNVCGFTRVTSHVDVADKNGKCDICKAVLCEHDYTDYVLCDEDYHWYDVTCGHNVGPKDKETHYDEDGDFECDVCFAECLHTHTYNTDEWERNESHHWHESTCGHDFKSGYESHLDLNGDLNCDVCQEYYEDPEVPDSDDDDYIVMPPHIVGGGGN